MHCLKSTIRDGLRDLIPPSVVKADELPALNEAKNFAESTVGFMRLAALGFWGENHGQTLLKERSRFCLLPTC